MAGVALAQSAQSKAQVSQDKAATMEAENAALRRRIEEMEKNAQEETQSRDDRGRVIASAGANPTRVAGVDARAPAGAGEQEAGPIAQDAACATVGVRLADVAHVTGAKFVNVARAVLPT